LPFRPPSGASPQLDRVRKRAGLLAELLELPLFSEYLKAMHGMPSASAPARNIGRSRRAGSQKLGAAKITPSAPAAATRSAMRWRLPAGSGS